MTLPRIIGVAAACLLALCAAAAPALAQTSSESGYDETGVLTDTGGTPAGAVLAERAEGGSLADDAGGGRPADGAVDPADRAGSGVAGTPTGSATLPFTGLDLIVIALLGLLLMGIGTVLRGSTRAR